MDSHHRYRWVGVNHLNQSVHGYLTAKNITLAKITLHQQGVKITHIKPTQRLLGYLKNKRVRAHHITQLTRQLADLLQSHIPLLQAFELLKSGEDNPRLKQLLNAIQTDVQSGIPLADALRKYPAHFNALFCHLIQAGEASGALMHLLKQLANHQERQAKCIQKIKKSLAYPLAILSIAACVTFGLLRFVVPQFQTLFESFHAELPFATQCLIQSADYIKAYGLISIISMGSCMYAARYAYQQYQTLTLKCDAFILKLPLLGPLFKAMILNRLTETLSILLSAGLPLVEALTIAAPSCNNLYYTKAILAVQSTLTEGQPLQRTLENTGLFPSMMTQIVGMGEASGQLQSMLKQLAHQQSEALNHMLDLLGSLFEPILMAVLGLWVGGLIIALYLPVFQLGAIIS